MQDTVYASVMHVESTDENSQHHKCNSDWCDFSTEGYKHRHGMHEEIMDLLVPEYDDLTDPQILSRCMHGGTQNVNECLNGRKWDRCAKEKSAGRRTVEEVVYSAVAHFHDGEAAASASWTSWVSTVADSRENSARHLVRKDSPIL